MDGYGVALGLMVLTAISVRIITRKNFKGKDLIGGIVMVTGAIWSADLLSDQLAILISGPSGLVWLSVLKVVTVLPVAAILHTIDRFIIDSAWLKFQSGLTGAIVMWGVWASGMGLPFLIFFALILTIPAGYYAGKWEADLNYNPWSIIIINILAFLSICAVSGLISAFVRDVGYDSVPAIVGSGLVGTIIAGVIFGLAQEKGDYKDSTPS